MPLSFPLWLAPEAIGVVDEVQRGDDLYKEQKDSTLVSIMNAVFLLGMETRARMAETRWPLEKETQLEIVQVSAQNIRTACITN